MGAATSKTENQLRAWAIPIPILAVFGAVVGLASDASEHLTLIIALSVGTVIAAASLVRSSNEPMITRDPSSRFLLLIATALATQLIGLGLPSGEGLAVQSVGLIVLFAGKHGTGNGLGTLFLLPLTPFLIEVVADAPGWQAGSTAVLLLVVALSAFRAGGVESFARGLVAAIAVYLAIAVLLYLLGIQGAYLTSYTGVSSAAFGPFDSRWRLPLAGSWTHAPMVGVFGMALSAALIRSRRPNRLYFACIGISALVIVAANGRTFLIAAVVLVIVATGVLGARVSVFIVVLAQTAWLAPLWWSRLVSGGGALTELLLLVLPSRSADATKSVLLLEGRTEIWDASFAVWASADFMHRLVGWGADGYLGSGASAEYRFVFSEGYTWTLQSPHNVFLEVLLSSGLVGVLLLGILLAKLVAMSVESIRSRAPGWRVIVASATALPLLGATEVAALTSNGNPVTIIGPAVVMFAVLAVQNARATAATIRRGASPLEGIPSSRARRPAVGAFSRAARV